MKASVFLALLLSFSLSAAIDAPVKLDTGLVSGTPGKNPDVTVYKGLPFAAPPTGNLRWHAPTPVAKWEGVRKADDFGPMCMQAPGRGANPPKMSEDCLYLNVWTAAKSPSEKRPVIVWIHPGGYTSGSGASPGTDGEALAKKGAVVVTINYRLGVLGFFAHPELTKKSDRGASGNYALMDQTAALEWVQKTSQASAAIPNASQSTAIPPALPASAISWVLREPKGYSSAPLPKAVPGSASPSATP